MVKKKIGLIAGAIVSLGILVIYHRPISYMVDDLIWDITHWKYSH